jgi:DNA gyrase/topoisomerase IV subunit A
MKRSLKYSFYLLISAVMIACSGNKHEHREITAELEEANKIHQSSLDLREEIMEIEKSLRDSETDYSSLKEELKTWDKDIIEVPGFEHSHDDEHQRKYHVHNPGKPFSDVEHLEYQKIMNEEIRAIHEKMTLLLTPKVMEEEG